MMIIDPNNSSENFLDALARSSSVFSSAPPEEWMIIASEDLGIDLNAAMHQIYFWAATSLTGRSKRPEFSSDEMAAYNALLLLGFSEALCAGICRDVDDRSFDAKCVVFELLCKIVPSLESTISALFFQPDGARFYDEMGVILSLIPIEREPVPPFIHKFGRKSLKLEGWLPERKAELVAQSNVVASATSGSLARYWATPPDLAQLIKEANAILSQETEAPAEVKSGQWVYACAFSPPSIAATLILARAALWSGALPDGGAVRQAVQDVAAASSLISRQPQACAAVDLACALGDLLQRNWG